MALFISESQIKQRVRGMLARRFLLRFHVMLILLWTFAAGLLTTKGLLWVGVDSMAVRYPLAVLMAYVAFLLGVRVWLWYVGIEVKGRHDATDYADLPWSGGGRSSAGEAPMRPGGGSFGGGGASGDYEIDPALSAELAPSLHALEPVGGLAETGGGAADSLLEGAAAADEAAIPLAIIGLILAALALVFAAVAYVIVDAPMVLAEAAFEAMLAGGLIRAVRRVDEPDWSAAVVRRTWLPAAVVLALGMAFALAVQHYRPGVRTVGQLLGLG